jgi:cytochrome c
MSSGLDLERARGPDVGPLPIVLALVALAMAHPSGAQEPPPGPGLGQPAAAQAEWDRLIGADGTGLPGGSGAASEGGRLYRERCERCHGPDGRGAAAEELAGGIGSLAGPHPDRTVGSFWPYAPPLFDYIRRAMPADAPLSLDNDAVYALTAYLLRLNGLVGEAVVVDADHLSRFRMPNREGFIPDQERAEVR